MEIFPEYIDRLKVTERIAERTQPPSMTKSDWKNKLDQRIRDAIRVGKIAAAKGNSRLVKASDLIPRIRSKHPGIFDDWIPPPITVYGGGISEGCHSMGTVTATVLANDITECHRRIMELTAEIAITE